LPIPDQLILRKDLFWYPASAAARSCRPASVKIL
jgi:hypothetical protein